MTDTNTASTETMSISAVERSRLRDRVLRLQAKFPIVQMIVLLAALAAGAITLPGFLNYPSIKVMLVLAALVGLAALGQTFVVLVGGFDLSVSGFLVAGALMVTQVMSRYEMPFPVALLVLIVGTALLGAVTGYLCHRFQIQPLIVTFAMGAIALGITQVQAAGNFGAGAPPWLSQLVSPAAATFGIPIPPIVVIWIVVTVLAGLFLAKTPAGRRLYATGANPRAAENVLIRTRRVWMLVFAFSGVAAGLTGVLLAGFAGSVDVSLGGPYLFQSLAAVIIGGTIFGGPGDYSRTVVGALLLTVLSSLLIGNGFTGADQQILYGVIILLAVAAYGRERRLRDRI